MKKLVVGFICVILAVMMIACVTCEAETTHELYALTTIVVNVDYDNDIVTVEDFNGFLWEFEGCEDWYEGDCCSMVMDNMGTDLIFDDVILNTHYNAWILERW